MSEELNLYVCIIQASYVGGTSLTHLTIAASNETDANNKAIVYALNRWPYPQYFHQKCEQMMLFSHDLIRSCGWERK